MTTETNKNETCLCGTEAKPMAWKDGGYTCPNGECPIDAFGVGPDPLPGV